MPKMVCVKCEVPFIVEKNGITVAEMFLNNTKVYKLWRADKWKCPICLFEIISGFGQNEFAEHYYAKEKFGKTLEEVIGKIEADGGEVVYSKEIHRG